MSMESPTAGNSGLHRLGPRHYIQHVVLGQERLLGERKYVTTLFADIVDSTPLAERLDPEDVTSVMNAAFREMVRPIDRHDGIVARLMGDGILCLFGAPVAHRDDAVRACHAGLEILDNVRVLADRMLSEYGLERLEVRVGISTGLAVVGEVGTENRAEYTAMGNSVNLAARLQSIARPGTVVVCPHTHDRIKKRFDVKNLGELKLKGKSKPVQVYRLLRPVRETSPGGSISLPLMGRDKELAEARQFLQQLSSGKGGMLNVVGGPGIGKSRFITELRKFQPPGTLWIQSACRAQTQQMSFWSINNALSQMLGLTDRLTAGERRRMIERRCNRLFDGTKDPLLQDGFKRTPSPARISTALYHVFGLPLTEGETSLLSGRIGTELQRFLTNAIGHFIEYMSRRSPIIMVWEDAHWMDFESKSMVRFLEDRIQAMPISIIQSARPRLRNESGPNKPEQAPTAACGIQLGPLDFDSSRRLAEGLLDGQPIPENDLTALVSSVEGNPFFLEEVVRAHRNSGLRPVANVSSDIETKSDELEIPHTVQAAILSRVDRLVPKEKHLLQIGAVFGRSFDPRALAEVVKRESGHCDISDLLQGLAESGYIRYEENHMELADQIDSRQSENCEAVSRNCEFTHGLMVDVIYNSLLKSERKVLHQRIGDVLERSHSSDRERLAPVLAYHYFRAQAVDKAIEYYALSGKQALALFSMERAEHCFTRIVTLLGSDESLSNSKALIVANEGLGDIHYYRGAHERSLNHYEQAISRLTEPADLARLHRKRGDLLEKQMQWEDAQCAYEKGLDTMASDFNEAEAGLIYAGLCLVYYHLDKLNTACDLGDLALLIEERQGNLSGIARARSNLGVVLTRMKAWDKAKHHFELARDQWDRLDDAYGLGSCCNNMGLLEMARENFDGARALFEESLTHFTDIDNKQGMARAHDNLGNLHVTIGDDQSARKHMEAAAGLLGSIIADSDDLLPEIWRSGLF